MATVGTAQIEFGADTSGVTDDLQTKINAALAKVTAAVESAMADVEADFDRAGAKLGEATSAGAQEAEQSADSAASRIGDSFEQAALSAEAALAGVDGDGFSSVMASAASVADSVESSFEQSAVSADSALSGIDGNGMSAATVSASSAAGAVRRQFSDAAGQADSALTGIDGNGFSSASSSATSSAGSIRDVMQQAASDVSSAWNDATTDITNAWAQTEEQANSTFGSGMGGKIAGGAAALGGLVGASNAVSSAFAKQTSIEDTTAVLEVLTGSADTAKSTMDDLVDSNWDTPIAFDLWAEAGKTLVAFGMDTEEVAGTVTALGEAGAASGEGAEGLQRLSRAFGQSLATGQMQNDTLNQLAESGVPALDILANHYGVTAAEMRDMASEGLPAEEAIRVLTEGIMEGTSGVAGETAAFEGTMATLAGTTSGTMANLGSAFTNVTSTAIEPLIGALQSFGVWLTDALYKVQDFINWLREGSTGAQVMIGVITAIGTAIAVFLIPRMVQLASQATVTAARKVAAWFSMQTAAWKASAQTVAAIGRMIGRWVALGAQALIQGARIAAGWVLAMGPIGWIVAGIAGIVGVFALLWNRSEGFRNFWIGLWDMVKNAVSSAWTWIQETWASYGQPVLDWIIGAFQWLGDVVQLIFRLLGATWEVLMTALGKAWAAWGQPIVDLVVRYFQWAWGNLQTVFGWIQSAWDGLWNWVSGVWAQYGQPVIDRVQFGFQWLQFQIDRILYYVRGYINLAGAKMRGLWDEYVQPMIDWVVGGFNDLLDTIRGWKDNVIGWFSDAGSWLWDAGKNIVQGLIDGAQSLLSNIGQFFLDVLPGWVQDPFKRALGIESPSTVFMGYGRNVGEGLAMGVESMRSQVRGATEGLSEEMSSVTFAPPTVGVPAAAPGNVGSAPSGDAAVGAAESGAVTAAAAEAGGAWQQMAGLVSQQSNEVVAPAMRSVDFSLSNTAMQFLGQTGMVINPAWTGMASNVLGQAQGVIQPAFNQVMSGLSTTASSFQSQINSVINPTWQNMGSEINAVKVGSIDPAFAGIQSGLTSVVVAFANGARDVGVHMQQMRRNTQDPVRFTMNTVFSDGLVDMWNGVSDMIGTDKISKKYASFATGGIMSGPYSPGRDNIRMYDPVHGNVLDLSGREAVMRPEFTQALGTRTVNALNAAARTGGVDGVGRYFEHLGAFKSGGVLPPMGNYLGGFRPGGVIYGGNFGGLSPITASHASWVGKHFPNIFTLTSAWRHTDSGHHSRGEASDWSNGGSAGSPQMKALARAMYATFPTAAELIHWPLAGWQNHQHGNAFNFGATTNAQHRDHVHFATTGPIGGGAAGLSSDGSWAPVDWGEMIGEMVAPDLERIQGAINANSFPGAVGGVPQGVFDGMADPMQDSLADLFEEFTNVGGGDVSRWAGLALQALQRHGYGAEHLDRMLKQIQIESTGDPRAMNYWDSNAMRGTPSGGLLQVIEPTYRRIRDSYPEAFVGLPDDHMFPLTNLTAGVGAVRQDWGGPASRWPTVDGYHAGGVMGRGQGLFHKTAFEPERILSPRQTEKFEQLVDTLDSTSAPVIRDSRGPGGDSGEGRTTRQVMVTQHITTSDPKKAADDVEDRLLKLLV